MFNLGLMLEETEADAAREWYKQASAAGDGDAVCNLGVLLVETDRETALRWFEQGAAAGDSLAMNNLGELLEVCDLAFDGRGDPGSVSSVRSLSLA